MRKKKNSIVKQPLNLYVNVITGHDSVLIRF